MVDQKTKIKSDLIIQAAKLGTELNDEFFVKLNKMCQRLDIKPEDILVLMYLETRFNPHAGKSGNAAGLNQIMPKFLKNFGFHGTADELRKLNAEDQIPYIENYFNSIKQMIGRPIRNAGDLYMANLWPAGLNYPGVKNNERDTPIITKNNGKAYTLNAPQMDFNKDGIITYGDFIDLTEDVKKRAEFQDVYNRFKKAVGNLEHQMSPSKNITSPSSNNDIIGVIDNLLNKFLSALAQHHRSERFVKKIAFKNNLLPNDLLIKIQSDNFENSIEFARVLCTILDEELYTNAYTYTDRNNVEVECTMYGPRSLCANSLLQLCEVLSETFKLATCKIGECQINTVICLNKKSNYQELDIKLAQVCYNDFHLKFANGNK